MYCQYLFTKIEIFHINLQELNGNHIFQFSPRFFLYLLNLGNFFDSQWLIQKKWSKFYFKYSLLPHNLYFAEFKCTKFLPCAKYSPNIIGWNVPQAESIVRARFDYIITILRHIQLAHFIGAYFTFVNMWIATNRTLIKHRLLINLL